MGDTFAEAAAFSYQETLTERLESKGSNNERALRLATNYEDAEQPESEKSLLSWFFMKNRTIFVTFVLHPAPSRATPTKQTSPQSTFGVLGGALR